MGFQDVELLSPYIFLYVITSIGLGLGVTALLTNDARKAGLMAILAGILAGIFINWICLSLMIIGGVMCYFGAKPSEK
jgi:TM2 domain-containing membrane protein YozV